MILGVPILVVLVGLLLIAWVFNLVRLGRLYVGYAVLVVFAIVSGTTALALVPVRRRLDVVFGALFPTVGIAVVVSTTAIVALVYVLTQQLAILEARRGEALGRAPSARPHVDG